MLKRWLEKFYAIITISIFVFLICRYIGNIINLIYIIFNINLNYVGSVKPDQIYNYRYSAPITLFVILITFVTLLLPFHSKIFNIIKKIILKILQITKKIILKILQITKKIILKTSQITKKKFQEFLNFLYGWQSPFLLGTIGFCIINNYIIIKQDTRPLVYDAAYYFTTSLNYYDTFKDLIIRDIPHYLESALHVASFKSPFFVYYFLEHLIKNLLPYFKPILYPLPFCPPLFLLASLPPYYFFGKSPDTAIMTNSLYIIILVFSVYGIGKQLYNKKTGVLAAFITATMPGLFALSRTYRSDFLLTTMTALSFYILLLSDNFKNKKYSILFGITSGLSFLVRQSYIVFFLPAIGLYVLLKLRIHKIEQIKNMILTGIILLIIATPWYLMNYKNIQDETAYTIKGGLSNEESNKNLSKSLPNNDTSYPNIIQPSLIKRTFTSPAKSSISIFYTFLFLLTLSLFFFYKKKKDEFILLGWIFIPYAFLFIMNLISPLLHATWRYILPCLPAIALFISASILRLKIKKYSQWIIIGLIIGGGLLQYAIISYSIGTDVSAGGTDSGIWAAKQEDWKVNEIIDLIKPKRNNTPPVILFVSVSPIILPTISAITFDYVAKLHGKRFDMRDPVSCGGVTECNWYNNSRELVLKSDYVIIMEHEKCGKRCSTGILKSDASLIIQANLLKSFKENNNMFELSKIFVLPDNSTLSVYERII